MDYVGTWIEVDKTWCWSTIGIDENSKGTYTYAGMTHECHDRVEGTARLGKKVLSIGIRKFELIEPATQIPDTIFNSGYTTSNMRMKVKIPIWLAASGSIVTLYKKK